jgi:hypothetical protein
MDNKLEKFKGKVLGKDFKEEDFKEFCGSSTYKIIKEGEKVEKGANYLMIIDSENRVKDIFMILDGLDF